jgi:hypothetical protein
MQVLTYTRTHDGFELYCDICDMMFVEEFVKSDIKAFADIHRSIHKRMNLDTPDLPDTLSDSIGYPQDYIEFSTELYT